MLNIAFQSRCQWGHLLLQLSNWGQCLGSSMRWLLQEHGYWRKAEKECYGNLIKERKQEKRQERWWKKEQDIRSTSKAEGKHCTKKLSNAILECVHWNPNSWYLDFLNLQKSSCCCCFCCVLWTFLKTVIWPPYLIHFWVNEIHHWSLLSFTVHVC